MMGFIDWGKVEPRKGQGCVAKTVLGERLTVAIINHEKPSGRGVHGLKGSLGNEAATNLNQAIKLRVLSIYRL